MRILRGTIALLAGLGLLAGCSDDDPVADPPTATSSSTTSTTLVPPVTTTLSVSSDPRLLTAADLGSTFEPSAFGQTPVDTACTVPLPTPDRRAVASYVSNAAQQLVSEELADFADVATARAAFAATRAGASCPVEGNDDTEGAAPTAARIAGADEAFGVGFASASGTNGVLVARRGAVIAVLVVSWHNGAITVEPRGTDELGPLAMSRLG